MIKTHHYVNAKVVRQPLTRDDIRLLDILVCGARPYLPEEPHLLLTCHSAYSLAYELHEWSKLIERRAKDVRRQLDKLRQWKLLEYWRFAHDWPESSSARLWFVLDLAAINRLKVKLNFKSAGK